MFAPSPDTASSPPAAANVFAPRLPGPGEGAAALDLLRILASVGEVAYEWSIETDELRWGSNAAAVLAVDDLAAIASGRAYAKLIDSKATSTRFDAVTKSPQRDGGAGVAYQLQYALRATAGDAPLWIEDSGRWFAGRDGRPAFAHGVVRAINERHAREERLAYLSRFDDLTGEMNRAHLAEVLEATIEDAARRNGSSGFMLIAIDHLSRLNEAYGFAVADEVIGAVARRLRTKMRRGDHLGRFSGNKFAVVLKNCSPESLAKAAERFLLGVRDDVVRTSAGPVAVTVTIGGVNAPRHGRTVQDVLARAHETLDAAKSRRRGSFMAYRPSLERDAFRRENVRSADEIVGALNERRVLLAFEPVAEAQSRRPAFYECLVRIRRGDDRLIEAKEIVPVAERLGLVRLLDHRVLELLIAEMAAVPQLRASLNVSPASTMDPDWWSALGGMLRAQPGVAERLIVEITETAAIQDIDDTRGFVARVKDLGCRIAIDDFGVGYTSFRNLRRLGVDIVKIDGAYVQNLLRCEDDRAFVHTLIDLAQRLKLNTVAEWVQDEATAQQLQAWGCDYLQGALIGLASVQRPWGPPVAVDRRRAPRD